MEPQKNIIYQTVELPYDLYLELDYDLLNRSDIHWISENCPHILEDLSCAPPPICEVSYESTLKKYVKLPKIMKKAKTLPSNLD
tara:strand:- start:301 stop:552 length:252 start_codon:yes stop_codon:yes gene_type:complete